jgi:23S rRNA pseudouridine1911/1915/1917 synthase
MNPPARLGPLVVAADEDGWRLDRFLAGRLGELSRSRLAGLIRAGAVQSERGTITAPDTRVKPGQTYEVALPPAPPARPEPQPIALAVVFEDRDIVVIDKPAGLTVHPGAGQADGTLVNALLAHCGTSLSGIGGVLRPGIVHRLDKLTSGLMVVAKNDLAHAALSAQFADHGRTGPLERAYLAFTLGAPPSPKGVVEAPLERHPTDRRRQAVAREGRGRHALTHYQVAEAYRAPAGARGMAALRGAAAALVRCRLETGRTHQIRVHMAAIGAPLLGDSVYSRGYALREAKLGQAAAEAVRGLGRQALHAAELGFAHPRDGRLLRFSSELPTELKRLHRVLGKDGAVVFTG